MKIAIFILFLFISPNIFAQVLDTVNSNSSNPRNEYYSIKNRKFIIAGNNQKNKTEENKKINTTPENLQTEELEIISEPEHWNTENSEETFELISKEEESFSEMEISEPLSPIEESEGEEPVEIVIDTRDRITVHYISRKKSFSKLRDRKDESILKTEGFNRKVKNIDCYKFKKE